MDGSGGGVDGVAVWTRLDVVDGVADASMDGVSEDDDVVRVVEDGVREGWRCPSRGVSGGIDASCAVMQPSEIGTAAHRLNPRLLSKLKKGCNDGPMDCLIEMS